MSVAALLLVCGAVAQYPVDQQVNMAVQPYGTSFDANPALYGGRMNFARPVSPFVGGNLYATGNVGRGLSLRSYSPIYDPTALRVGLGSGALWTFRRDSVSVGDAVGMRDVATFAQPYFDPARTAPTVSHLRGVTGTTPGLTQPTQLQRLDLRINPTQFQQGVYSQVRVPTALPTVDMGAAVAAQHTPAIFSSIFGPQPVQPIPDVTPLAERATLNAWQRLLAQSEGGAREAEAEPGAPVPLFSPLVAEPLDRRASPLDVLLRGGAAQRNELLTVQAGETGVPDGQTPESLTLPPWGAPQGRTPASPELAVPRPVDASLLPGFDVFTDMRLALELVKNPAADWFEEMQRAGEVSLDPTSRLEQDTREDAQQFLGRMLETPLRTLTGGGATEFNDQMLKAESLLDIGHFQEAVDRYERAAQLNPLNPLPLIGKGHALLAMGSYSSAAEALLQGIERFPEVVRFSLDLADLMGGGERIDIRRADLLRRLEQSESPQLLFLLGYLEYHTGDRERGLAHLDQAAAHPLAPAAVVRYPALLRGEAPLPVPRWPQEAAPDVPPPTDELKAPPSEPLRMPPPVE